MRKGEINEFNIFEQKYADVYPYSLMTALALGNPNRKFKEIEGQKNTNLEVFTHEDIHKKYVIQNYSLLHADVPTMKLFDVINIFATFYCKTNTISAPKIIKIPIVPFYEACGYNVEEEYNKEHPNILLPLKNNFSKVKLCTYEDYEEKADNALMPFLKKYSIQSIDNNDFIIIEFSPKVFSLLFNPNLLLVLFGD